MKISNIYKSVLLIGTLLLAFSCQEKETPYYSPGVHLKAAMPYIATKGTDQSTSGILDFDYDKGVLEIGVARIDQNHTPSYPAFQNCGTKILANLNLPDASNGYLRDIEFTSEPQFFLNGYDAIRYATWYPARDFTTDDDSTYVTFPVDGQTDVLYGNISVGSKNKEFDTVTFNHALCVYKIYAYAMLLPDQADSVETLSEKWGKITSMSIANMPANCILTLPLDDNKEYGISYNGTSTINISDPSNNIYYNPGDSLPLGIASRRLVAKCIGAPPSSGILDISLTTEHASASQEISIARNFKPGCAYDIILRFSDHGFVNADVSVGEWTDYEDDITREAGANMYYNLSTYGTANCYMIHSANYGYSFDGTAKGNKNSSMVGNESTTINPGYIDILWTDMPEVSLDLTDDGIDNPKMTQTVSLITNRLSQGKVLVYVQGDKANIKNKVLLSEGNVIIAAYTDDTKAEMLWTWHLWITDRVRTHGYTNGYTVQDRNLGAVSNTLENNDYTKMHGLYYQWGRQTPFPNPSKGIFTMNYSTSTTTAANAVANPTTIYGTSGSTWLNNGVAYADKLWGWKSDSEDPAKTMYDPCPYGYMVSDYRMWKNMSDFEKQGTFVFHYDSNGGVNVSIASNTIWYPFQGHLAVNGSIVTSPHPFYMWSNSVSSASGNPYYFIYDRAGDSDIATDSQRNIAAPVRCIASRGNSVVKDLSEAQTANCYMVSKEGYYKFKATVRGNGVGSLFPLGGTKDAEIKGDLESVYIDPDHVAPLWWQGDFNSTLSGTQTDPQNYMCISMLNGGVPDSEGYVTFNIDKFYKGNTILAAYDNDGIILWTWHIWLTDEPEVIATGKYSLMDRFLGATFAPDISGSTITFANDNQRLATYGFYYQWGRKDPIPGPPGFNSNGTSTASSTWWQMASNGTWSKKTSITTAAASSIATIAKAPLNFYKSTTTQGDTGSGWFPASFADGYTTPVLWGYAVADWRISGQTFSKTMHDPCPPGYRTPFHYAWDGEVAGLYSGVNYRYIPAGETEGNVALSHGETGFTTNGIVLNKTNFHKNWYPFTGYRKPTTGECTSVGTEGRMFTGMPMQEYNTRYYNYNSTNTGQRYGNHVSVPSGSSSEKECGTAYGFSVRCQKE